MNRNISKRLFFVAAILVFSFYSDAQEKIIQGVVTTFDSIPIINAEVSVKGTKQKVLTDTLGRFSVMISDDDERLKVSANGFFNQKVKLNEKTKFVAVNLKIRPGEKNIQYAIGYGHVSDKDKLNALATLQNNDVDFSQYNNIYDLIKGRFAGVQVINGEIIIRGINSINSSNAALIVVDGVPVSGDALSSITPAHIKSINVLKDGGSAIYGSRGANGVVIIETKQGGDF